MLHKLRGHRIIIPAYRLFFHLLVLLTHDKVRILVWGSEEIKLGMYWIFYLSFLFYYVVLKVLKETATPMFKASRFTPHTSKISLQHQKHPF